MIRAGHGERILRAVAEAGLPVGGGMARAGRAGGKAGITSSKLAVAGINSIRNTPRWRRNDCDLRLDWTATDQSNTSLIFGGNCSRDVPAGRFLNSSRMVGTVQDLSIPGTAGVQILPPRDRI